MNENPFAPPRIVDPTPASVSKPKLLGRRKSYSFAIAFVTVSAVLFWWRGDEQVLRFFLILAAFALPPLAIVGGIAWMCKRAER
jgi:Na+/melibiose symporter-like transporter